MVEFQPHGHMADSPKTYTARPYNSLPPEGLGTRILKNYRACQSPNGEMSLPGAPVSEGEMSYFMDVWQSRRKAGVSPASATHRANGSAVQMV